ncbi:MAG TPA: hypothetical protein VJ810_05795 [Blastocatellia bacterium]|nr:hypothetical protein [Blastocatellia bacterium]
MFQFAYFPYFPSPNIKIVDVKVNRIHIFNFAELKDKYINDLRIRNRIQQLCSMYVDSNGEPSNQIAIAVIDDNYSFNVLSNEQIEDLHNYAMALLFCSLVNNKQNGAWASEHFKLYHQNFDLTSDMITYETGSYIKLAHTVRVSEKKFHSPDYVFDSIFYSFDKKLFAALANLIDAGNPDDQFIFKALDWVKLAFSNSEGVSMANRLVMLCTAFEVFFKLPRNNKEAEFVQRLGDLLGVSTMELLDDNHSIVGTGHPKISRKTKDGRDKMETIYGWWARDFYWVRSEIVHTGDLASEDYVNHNKVPHHELALKMLRFCLYRALERQNYLNYEVKPELGDFHDFDRLWTMIELRKIERLIATK